MSDKFVHLHVHSEYSLIDGSIKIDDLIKKSKEFGFKSIALTDHGNMFGAIEFYNKAKEFGIKPILGSEIFFEGFENTLNIAKYFNFKFPKIGAFHLVLLAKNLDGYKNLLKIVSAGYENRIEEIPIVDFYNLNKFKSNLIVLSSSLKGELGFLIKLWDILEKKHSKYIDFESLDGKDIFISISKYIENMLQLYGDNFYIEIIDNNLSQQKSHIYKSIQIANYFNIKLVATGNVHYLSPDFKESHNLMIAIKSRFTLKQANNRKESFRFHLLDDKEFFDIYSKYQDAISNTVSIAQKCNVELEFGTYHLPKLKNIDINETINILKKNAHIGLSNRLKEKKLDQNEKTNYIKRLDYEIITISNMGFAGYFLIVEDFVNWAKSNLIPVGPGRGSGAGSLVAYALNITDIDPLEYNLLFERFLNPQRISMPDFDIDFCQWRRDEVINYVINKYGDKKVAQIITFGKMQAKGALKNVGRAMSISYPKVDEFCRLIPKELNITLDNAIKQEPRLKKEMKKDQELEKLMFFALQCEGICTHTSVHAAGIVISDGDISDYAPSYRSEDSPNLITQFPMNYLDQLGLIKFDFLGLKTLTVIGLAEKLIKEKLNKNFSIKKINLKDKKVYENISKGHNTGVFQMESIGMQRLVVKLKPNKFEDIIALLALFRPGPLRSGMVDSFIKRKHGQEKIQSLHPLITSVLDDTYGIILYQEQVQKIASELANYSLAEADILRRAMGKKKPKEMAKQKDRFLKGCLKNQIDKNLSIKIFDLMAQFAEYGFNKSHSTAYGLISYQTAFLKTYFPKEYMCSIMTCDFESTDKIVKYIEECKYLKIKVKSPNINYSLWEFSVFENKYINFGMSAIKGLGKSVFNIILKEREKNAKFLNLYDFVRRINLTKIGLKNLELLAQSGALDVFEYDPKLIISNLNFIIKFSQNLHDNNFQKTIFDNANKFQNQTPWEKWPKKINKSIDFLKKERQILGAFISDHPILKYKNDIKSLDLKKISDMYKNKKNCKNTIGILSDKFSRTIKNNRNINYIKIEDENISIFTADFNNKFKLDEINIYSPVVFSFETENNHNQFLIKKLETLDNYRKKYVNSVIFKINLLYNNIAEAINYISIIKNLLIKYPGNKSYKIILNVYDKNMNIIFKNKRKGIDISNLLILEIEKLISDKLEILYQKINDLMSLY